MAAIASRRRVVPKEQQPNSSNDANATTAPDKRKGHQDVTRTKQWIGYCALTVFLLILFVAVDPPKVAPMGSSGSMLKLVGEDDVEDRGLETSAVASSQECSIEHLSMEDATVAGAGGKAPVIVRGWAQPKDWQEQTLMKKVGHYQQYIKDGFVQPVKDKNEELCTLPGAMIATVMKKSDKNLLFFTNSNENEAFMKDLAPDYQVPSFVSHIDGFQVFSAVAKDRSHTFHKHGESWLGQVEGRRMWWFLPPTVTSKPDRVNACEYLKGTATPPEGAISCLQEPGDLIWFPKDWYHATCALDEWTVGIGAQQGPLIRQQFDPLDQSKQMSQEDVKTKTKECLGMDSGVADKEWTWFDGDLNAYYNSLEKDHNRNPDNIASYAVHRWMGEKHTTETHYELILDAVHRHHSKAATAVDVFDGGCGLGSALMWMEKMAPQWKMVGHTISEEQHKFITTKLPKHKFNVNLKSYNELDQDFDIMYSIEALIHSPNVTETFQEWAKHLNEGGVIVIIDDFISVGTDKEDPEVVEFARSWLANSLFSPTELGTIGRKFGLRVVENRDLDAEFRINELNYKNKMPNLNPDNKKTHQGWMGSKWRQLLTLKGKVTYNMVVFQKGGAAAKKSLAQCNAVPTKKESEKGASYAEITPQLMSGKGDGGGDKMACISSWYCCNKGLEWWEKLEADRTDNTAYLKLDKELFGHYVDSFAKHLNKYYKTYPEGAKGRFLDIGGTGSTASGMQQVTSKFQHFAGPLDYWILDSDIGAKDLERTIYCDIDNCPAAETCGFDVTFSHTVLEHAQRPWESFDTIARITKKGGLTMHLVPWSYQFHATPDDNYRFSHKAVTTLLEDRGFTVLEVGYDICTKPQNMLKRVDEHYDVIWLVYVIGRKN